MEDNNQPDAFEAAAAELENSIAPKQSAEESSDPAVTFMKGFKELVSSFAKAKGGPGSDLSAEKDKRGTLTEAGKDPAETPAKSGEGYKDSSKYETRKGEDMEDEGDEEESDEVPSFFKKKKKKKAMKKSEEASESEDEELSDAEEFMEGLENGIDHLAKSCGKIEEGVAVFGELVAELADPRRDKLLIGLAKAMNLLVTETREIKKSLEANQSIIKSIATMPGMPKVVGAQLQKAEQEQGLKKSLSGQDRDRLFKAASKGVISKEEYNQALQTGDMSCLEKAAK